MRKCWKGAGGDPWDHAGGPGFIHLARSAPEKNNDEIMEVKHMKRSRKTLFALLLALVMALGLTATAWAAEGQRNCEPTGWFHRADS